MGLPGRKPLIVPGLWDAAYAAGFLDGEGCIRIEQQAYAPGRPKRSMLRVQITCTNLPILEWHRERWGGSLNLVKRGALHQATALKRNWKPAYAWLLANQMAGDFLADVQPFVRIKRPQIDNALAFQRLRPGRGRWKSITDEDRARDNVFYLTAKRLNARGVSDAVPSSPERDSRGADVC